MPGYSSALFGDHDGGLDLEGDLRQFATLAEQAGRSRLPVTAFAWQLDEAQLYCYANAGVERVVIALQPRDRPTVDEFLQRCAQFAQQLAA